ncbi:hypothetical protein ACF08M_05150 [Streptomyces sp. NPDC015032]|uniref:hypothetical protein n=1 Tax=Streptomyces sp. NPDC015032 TaxID=3364937 RepID=UPI0036F9B57D
MTLSRYATYGQLGQLSLFVALLIGIVHLLGGGGARLFPVPWPAPRPGRNRRAPLSVLRI